METPSNPEVPRSQPSAGKLRELLSALPEEAGVVGPALLLWLLCRGRVWASWVLGSWASGTHHTAPVGSQIPS